MINGYAELKESENIVPIPLENKENYYSDLYNIEQGLTGRVDVMFLNQFLQEAVQMIINSISLFEKGYFDAAFYSLRQSLEISTTIMYFADDDDQNRKQELKKWENQDWFPAQSQMLKALKERGNVFFDIKVKMADFLGEIEKVKGRLNKYVHKQGLDKFYTARKSFYYSKDKENKVKQLVDDFQDYLVKSIGATAVYRLVIDPFPILLLDEAIYNRTSQFMSESYSEDFIDKYIGRHHIENYKKTDLYKGYYDQFISSEEMLPSVLDIVKYEYVDRSKLEEIVTQTHLLSIYDRVAVAVISISDKVANVYCFKGIHRYFTNTKTKRIKTSWSSDDFLDRANEFINFNMPYDEVFLTYMKTYNESFYIEHNEVFIESEKELIEKIIKEINNQMNHFEKVLEELKNK